MLRVLITIVFLSLVQGHFAFAENLPAAPKSQDKVLQAVNTVIPGASISDRGDSKFPGFKEVVINGQVMFVSNDGRYVILGAILDLNNTKNKWELGLDIIQKYRNTKLNPIKNTIVYKAKGDTKANIRIFTDIDCGACRKLHQEIPKLNELGIQVEYLSFPRYGLNSTSSIKAKNVWCSEDANIAMDNAKSGEKIVQADCETNIAKHFKAGREISVVATPTIVFGNGNMTAGYLPAIELAKMAIENSNGELK